MADFNYNEDFYRKMNILGYLMRVCSDFRRECPYDINDRVCIHTSLVETELEGLRSFPNDKPFVRHAMRMLADIYISDFVGYKVGQKHPDNSEEFEREWTLKHSISDHLLDYIEHLENICNDEASIIEDNEYECKTLALETTEQYGRNQFPDNIHIVKNTMEYLRLIMGNYLYQFGSILHRGGRRRTNRTNRRTTRKHRRTRRRC